MKYLRLSLPSQQWLVHGLAAIFPPNSLLFPNREGFKMLLLLLSLHEDLYERSAHLKMAPRRYWNMWMWRLKHLKGTHFSFFLVSCWHRVNRGRCQCLSLCSNNCECETTGYILGDFGTISCCVYCKKNLKERNQTSPVLTETLWHLRPVFGDRNRYFNPNHDLFLALTN